MHDIVYCTIKFIQAFNEDCYQNMFYILTIDLYISFIVYLHPFQGLQLNGYHDCQFLLEIKEIFDILSIVIIYA